MVATTDCAGLYADADLAGDGLGDLALLEFEICAGLGDDGDFHFRHLLFRQAKSKRSMLEPASSIVDFMKVVITTEGEDSAEEDEELKMSRHGRVGFAS